MSTETRPYVVDLRDAAARSSPLSGGKAAALAKAATAGLPTLPGVVLTTAFSDAVDAGADPAAHPAVREAFDRADGGQRDLVARSSSVVEDQVESSMAGQFDSVIGIHGFDAFVAAVSQVLDSRRRAGAADSPIAVLVQPLIDPEFGGVMFGVDPVSGRSDRRVVSAVWGGPEPLVSGEVDGARYLLDEKARALEFDANDGPQLPRPHLRRLVALSNDVARTFDGPQDVEWAIGRDGALFLLQSRPVTTEVRGIPLGPIYGPGPVAETFPEPLTELERDLWIPPLREAVREAVLLAGAATTADVDASEIVVDVEGHVAIDLRLAGDLPVRHGVVSKINPVPAYHRLRGAWRVGRLRSALPALAELLLDRVDADLERVPSLDDLTGRQLIALLHRSQSILRALHAHEILMGMLTNTGQNRLTGASVALRVLAEARRDGMTDREVLSRSPVVLALVAPRVAPAPQLPSDATSVYLGDNGEVGNNNGILREALRLRVRWVQELTGRAAWDLGERLAASGQVTEPELIRHMTLQHVEAVAMKRAVVIPALVEGHEHNFGAPLPAMFRLSDRGKIIRAEAKGAPGGGTAAGGGVGLGPVTYDTENPPDGSVLVTTTLTPALAPLLPRLSGFIAETGSVLSHLAILARENGVATVVSYAHAKEELHEGTVVLVNGESGQVIIENEGTAMKIIAWLAGIGTLLGGSVYMVVSLNRWEWNRALFFGLIVVIAEIALATGLVLRRIERLQYRLDPAVTDILRATRPPSPNRFAWLQDSATSFNVFITFLVGGGVILSGMAWVVDRVAAKTSTPKGEQRLAAELGPISYPKGGILVDDVTVLAQDVPGADDAQIRMLLRRAGHAS